MDIPYKNYTVLAVRYSQKENEKSLEEKPRAEELRAKIEVLINEAHEKDLLLDDETVATSKDAADIRAKLDLILPEFQALAETAAKRLAMTRHLRERMESHAATPHVDVQVPIGEAMVLLNLAEPNFG